MRTSTHHTPRHVPMRVAMHTHVRTQVHAYWWHPSARGRTHKPACVRAHVCLRTSPSPLPARPPLYCVACECVRACNQSARKCVSVCARASSQCLRAHVLFDGIFDRMFDGMFDGMFDEKFDRTVRSNVGAGRQTEDRTACSDNRCAGAMPRADGVQQRSRRVEQSAAPARPAMRTAMRTGMHTDMRTEMRTDMCTDMCAD